MKINGGGQPPVPGADAASPGAEGLEKAGLEKAGLDKAGLDRSGGAGKTFAETVAGAGTARPPEVAGNGGDPAVRALAAELDAGKLDARTAVDRLIEHVVNLQVGSGASPQAREQVAAALREAVASDPLIAEKLKRLG
jgi:hypothetical protein